MSVRSDFTSDVHLGRVLDAAVHPDVKAALVSARRHMNSGSRSHRRGGKILIQMLETVRRRAADAGEWQVVRLVQDSLDYAEGRILQPDLNDRYRLFRDGHRSRALQNFVGNMFWVNYKYVAEASREFLDEHPGAGVDALITYIESLAEDGRFIDAPENRPGWYRLLRGRAERAVWLERVLQERVDIEDPEEAARRIVTSPEAVALLAADTEGQMVLRAAELQRRAAGLEVLRKVVEHTAASEHALQRALQGQHWIFGGRFVGEAAHRRLVRSTFL